MFERTPYPARVLCIALLTQITYVGNAWALRPSDCLPGHVDSTCATGVAAKTTPPVVTPDLQSVYSGPIAGLPTNVDAYWGFDFLADAQGVRSPAPHDMFINRSAFPITIDFLFTMPTDHVCEHGCLPRLEFRTATSWSLSYATFNIASDTVSARLQVPAGGAYGWMMALEQTHDAWIVVMAPIGANPTMAQIGLDAHPEIANPISPAETQCQCWDGTVANCWPGTRYSSGLMGPYSDKWSVMRPDAWSNCPPRDGG